MPSSSLVHNNIVNDDTIEPTGRSELQLATDANNDRNERTLTNAVEITGEADGGVDGKDTEDVGRGGILSGEGQERGRARERGKKLQLRLDVPEQGIVLPSEPEGTQSADGNLKDNNGSPDRSRTSKSKPLKWRISHISARLKANPRLRRLYNYRPSSTTFKWVPANFTYPKLKPVIRCALAAWLSLVLVVIPSVEDTLGQASFLILIAAFLSPPAEPFVAVAERELIIMLFVTASYAFSCLAIFLSSLARSQIIYDLNTNDIFSGYFLEAGPTAVCAAFLFVGSSFLLYLKARKGPGPFVFATVLGCITLDISLLVAPLYPYPFYLVGRQILIPIAAHSALSILASIFVFPETVNAQFGKRLRAVFNELRKGCDELLVIFDTAVPSASASSPDHSNHSSPTQNEKAPSSSSSKTASGDIKIDPKPFTTHINLSEQFLVPLAATGRLIRLDISWGRFGPRDWEAIHEGVRRMCIRANGMSFYFKIIDLTRERFPVTPNEATPAASRVASRASSRVGSRASSRGSRSNSRDVSPDGSRSPSVRSLDTRRFSRGSALDSPDTDTPGTPMPVIRVNGESVGGDEEGDDFDAGRPESDGFRVAPDLAGGSVARRRKGREWQKDAERSESTIGRHDHGNIANLFMHMHRNRNRHRHKLERYHSDFGPHAIEDNEVDEKDVQDHKHKYKPRHRKVPHPFSHLHFLGHGHGHWRHSRLPLLSDTPPQSPSSQHGHPSVLHLNLHNPFPSLSHISLPDWHASEPHERPVGVFESQRYLNLETRITLSHTGSASLNEQYMAMFLSLLRRSTEDLVRTNAEGLKYVVDWFENVDKERLRFGWRDVRDVLTWYGSGKRRWTAREKAKWDECIKQNEEIRGRLKRALDEFRTTKRHLVLSPYRSARDPRKLKSQDLDDEEHDAAPPPRYLFQSYVYQYHLLHFSNRLLDVIDELNRLEKERRLPRLWIPHVTLSEIFSWGKWLPSEDIQRDDDEDPDIIPGIDPSSPDFIGFAKRRDPDALPATTMFQVMCKNFYSGLVAVTKGNVVFAFKAGILTVLLSLTSFFPSTAMFSYVNKSVWGVFMGQLTLSRFRGDTAFGLTSRILSTFLGGIVGVVIWYISSGSGIGNPYGVGVVGAIVFPFFFFGRLYWPGPPMTNIIFFVTSQLVVGYSWQDTHLPTLSSPGVGINVAWRRFVLVIIGVVSAFIFSFLPPSTTLRRYIRTTHSTTVAEIGQLYCDVVSFASGYREPGIKSSEEIARELIAVRSKLTRVTLLRTNVVYEFSLAGRWPLERYVRLQEVQMEIAYLLSHLRSVVDHLDPAWARAFLQRTRFLEGDFQGDVLAVISLISTALRAGVPLPQITPSPLLDRFVLEKDSLNILRGQTEEDYGLPRTLTIDTLENEQYLFFSVGVATAFGIVTRLDRLMVATKELVGESFHIHGIHGRYRSGGISPINTALLDPELAAKQV